jgi:hypothetical protein
MDLRKIISYNNYEGFRLVLGYYKWQVLKNFRIEGYSAYGTKDGNFKYNIGLSTRVGKFSDSGLASYTNDVNEIANTLYTSKKTFKLYDPRPINISTFITMWVESYLKTQIILKQSIAQSPEITPKFNYVYNLNGRLYSNYIMTTAMVSCSGILSVIICKHRLAELKGKRVSKIHFSVYTISTKSIRTMIFNLAKLILKRSLRRNI